MCLRYGRRASRALVECILRRERLAAVGPAEARMSAYLIANINVQDPDAYQAYRSRTPEIIARHGGRFIVRGGAVHVLEGEPEVHRLVVIEFPDVDAAKGFYECDEYQQIIPLRTNASEGSLLIVEGAEG